MAKLVYFVVLIAVGFAYSIPDDQPTECYQCSFADGNACNELDLSKVGKQSCSDIPTDKNTTGKVVCYTFKTNWLGRDVTERGCHYRELDGVELCDYFERSEATVPFTDDYHCTLCYDDLCNGLP